METDKNISVQVARYMLCLNKECNRKEECLRCTALQYNTSTNIRINVLNPLCYPKAGEECAHFRSNRKIRLAWGFRDIYNDMPSRFSRAIHQSLESFFGHTTYYRYRNQKLGLTPEQQESIRQICLRHGWKKEVIFDRYSEEYNW